MKSHDLIVIGGGPAGVTAALRARELGASVALVERKWLGGTCTNDGCVPTRVLAKTARLMRETNHFGSYGLMGNKPDLDFNRLLTYARSIVQSVLKKKDIVAHLDRAGITLSLNAGGATFKDSHTLLLEDGSSMRGDKIIICAGGHSRKLPFPGSENVITHSAIWSLKAMPRRVAVVGAAATGCQVASVLAAFGAQVWLLEVAPRILTVEDSSISATVSRAFQRHGIKVISGIQGVEKIDSTNGRLELWYRQEGKTLPLEIDGVVMAVGWLGNIESLSLSAANVRTERGYIVVNDQLQTSAPNIFAAGDITGRVMLVQTANFDARLAAENAVLGGGKSYTHKIVPHGGFTDPEYGGVGLTEDQARAAENDCAVAMVPYTDLDRAVIDGHPEGFCKMIVSRKSRSILGVHVVGEQAVEIVQMAATAMAAKMLVEQLADLELAYPTYTSIIGLAARQLAREIGAMPMGASWGMLGMHGAEWEHGDAHPT